MSFYFCLHWRNLNKSQYQKVQNTKSKTVSEYSPTETVQIRALFDSEYSNINK